MQELFEQAFADAVLQLENLLANAIAYLPRLVVGLVVGVVSLFVARKIKRAAQRVADRIEAPVELERLIVNVLYVLAVLVAITVTLGTLGIDVAGLVAGLGISGLVIGFALRDIVENLMAGALILVQRAYKPGDLIEVDGTTGFIKDIKLRATTLRTLDNIEVIIPNSTVYTSKVINYSTYSVRRREVDIGLGYTENIPKAVEAILAEINTIEGVADNPPPSVQLTALGDSAITGKIYFHINLSEHDLPEVHSQVVLAVQEVAKTHQIDIPYQTITVLGNK